MLDSDTPPFIDAQTNEPGKGPNGAHIFLPGDEAIQKMTIGKGLKVELFASEKEFPELVNPVQMAFDTRGRLWVAAWKNYPHWQPKTPMDDKLLILEDTNGDGKADKRTVFAGDLNNPTGFEFYNGGVILAQAPNLVFLKDTNGDDRYDTKEILLDGLDTADTHHTINSFTFDPGGALYMREGHLPSDRRSNRRGGRRCARPTAACSGSSRARAKFEVYIPMNFPNPHGHVFDSLGPRHRVRRDRRPAVLRPVVLDEEVLPGDGDEQGAAARQRADAPGRRRRDPVQPSLPRGDAGQRHRAQHDRIQGAAQLQAERGRRRSEVGGSRADPAVRRRELPPGGRRGRARRRAVFRRLAQPDHRAHAAQPARHVARPRCTAASTA